MRCDTSFKVKRSKIKVTRPINAHTSCGISSDVFKFDVELIRQPTSGISDEADCHLDDIRD